MNDYPIVYADVTGNRIAGYLVSSGLDYHIIAQVIEITGHAKHCQAIPRTATIRAARTGRVIAQADSILSQKPRDLPPVP